ncbi:MAG: bifunctional DNA primase/polymerase [Patescibacteria group bacterium]|nr:bifunctional DNA primase/polymerase [Patescibacteria group bacterium]
MSGHAYAYFPLVPGTKRSAVTDWPNALPGQYAPTAWDGTSLKATDLVIDADPRRYPPGRDLLAELVQQYQINCSRVVATPGGGYHVYLTKPADKRWRVNQKRWPGLEFKSAGQQVVRPGSLHGDKEYVFVPGRNGEPSPIPDDLAAALEPEAESQTDGAETSRLMFDVFASECEAAPPAVEGQGGDNATYRLACRGRDLGLDVTDVYEAMRDKWNYRCAPAWEEAELFAKVRHAFSYARNAAGAASPAAVFTADMAAQVPNSISEEDINEARRVTIARRFVPAAPDANKLGRLYSTVGNALFYLNQHPDTKDQFYFDEFSKDLKWRDRPSWRQHDPSEGRDVTDRDLHLIRAEFANKYRLDISELNLITALQALALPFHDVKAYLNRVAGEWDGKARLDRILIDTAGARNTPYHRAIGAKTLIAAVRRIFEPGCKCDNVLVLEGPQGINKSMWIDELGGPWYGVTEINRGDKDTYQNIRGKWIMELPELNATLSRADVNWLKGMLSSRIDTYRPSYARKAQDFPRQSIFIATINPTGAGAYLKDEENRRYWVASTPRFDIERLKRDRDQYFGEAVVRMRKGEPHWLDDNELEEARAEQELRREKDPWEEVIAGWIATKREFQPIEIYALLGLGGASLTGHHRNRISAVLKRHGWQYEHVFAGGKWTKTLSWEDLL